MKLKQTLILLFSFIFLPYAYSQTYRWQSMAMGGGGFVSAIVTNRSEANLMYARTDVGGAYKWDHVKSEWVPLLDWVSENETTYLGTESIATDPQLPNRVYILAGISYFNSGKTAILRSEDYGKTFSITDVSTQFKAHGNGMGRQNGEKLQVDPNNSNILYCGTRYNGLFKSTNAGVSWTRQAGLNVTTTPNEAGISFIVVDPKSAAKGNPSQTIYAAVSRSGSANLYVSKNGGTTFAEVPNAPTEFMPQRAALAADGSLYITYANGAGPHGHWSLPEPMSNGAVWKLNTATGAWTNITPAGFAKSFSGVSVDPVNSNKVIISTINTYLLQYKDLNGIDIYGDRIFVSTNGGTGWKDIIAPGMTLDANGSTWINGSNIHWTGAIEFNPNNTNQAWVTSGNGIFSCDDVNAARVNWKFNVKGLEETVPRDMVSITNGPLFSVIFDYDGFKHADPALYAPIIKPRMGTTTGIAFAAANPSILLRVGSKMYYTENQGTSWTECSINGKEGKVAVSANGSTLLHAPVQSSITYRSTNKGASWIASNGLNITEAVPVADMVNTNRFYAYNNSNGSFMVSTDAGANFTSAANIGSGGSKIARAVPGKEGHVWVALNNGGLTRTVNSGQSFTKISSVTACSAVGLGKAAPGSSYHTIYIWGRINNVTGVFRSVNEGSSWVRVNDDEHEYGGLANGQFVVGDMNTYGRVFISTAGRGVAYGELTSTTTALDNSRMFSDVSENELCFPNPFSTNIYFTAEGQFEYAIYDLTGTQLEQGIGNKSSEAGHYLKTGVYVLKIKSRDGERHTKIIKQ